MPINCQLLLSYKVSYANYLPLTLKVEVMFSHRSGICNCRLICIKVFTQCIHLSEFGIQQRLEQVVKHSLWSLCASEGITSFLDLAKRPVYLVISVCIASAEKLLSVYSWLYQGNMLDLVLCVKAHFCYKQVILLFG